MRALDWAVLGGTLAFIAMYGAWRARGTRSASEYLRGSNQDNWSTIGLSVMATQASAITFLSTPGQAYEDGMRFVQFYFGLPIAMIILSAVVVPRYYKLQVFTAYEFLEKRFDLKTRQLAAFLFLVQRGLAAGITIYAPSIILSKVLGWSLDLTNVVIGSFVILYTVGGGTVAVSQTQKQQMIVMMGGITVAFVWVLWNLPPQIGFSDALHIAGAMGKMNVVDFSFNPDTRYTFWSGITGGLFLAMSYFGTDQSQVQRYLSGRSITESRLGLLFNGLFKVPMQFFILLVGLMVLVFHQFERPPLFFNEVEWKRLAAAGGAPAVEAQRLEGAHAETFTRKRAAVLALDAARDGGDETAVAQAKAEVAKEAAAAKALRQEARALVAKNVPGGESKDTDYVFLTFVLERLPQGLIGLLLAVILCAAMSSSSSEFAALGSTTMVDFYRRSFQPGRSDRHYLWAARGFTVFWGLLAIGFALFASLIDNLIQAVNLLGSLFYGTILGIFLVGFFNKRIRGTPVFIAALLSEAIVIGCYVVSDIGFLWFNVIGCALVFGLAGLFERVWPRTAAA
ncbi:MAG TPA: sodium:solute symporter [Polyangia bacterium]